jgi:hypothetical protein
LRSARVDRRHRIHGGFGHHGKSGNDQGRCDRREDRAADARTDSKDQPLLEDINRSLHPFRDLDFSFSADVDLQRDALEGYRSRLDHALQSFPAAPANGSLRPDELYASQTLLDGTVKSVSVPLGSCAFPQRSEAPAYSLFRYVSFSLIFFKQQIPEDYFAGKSFVTDLAQLTPDLAIDIEPSQNEPELELQYDVDQRRYSVRASAIKSDPILWQSTGRLISIPDLAGAQLFIRTRNGLAYAEGNNDSLSEVRKGIRLTTLVMNVAGGRHFRFRAQDLREYTAVDGLKYYVLNFPKEADGLSLFEVR